MSREKEMRMWKYKLSCPFGGFEELVLIVALLSMFLGVSLGILAEKNGASVEMVDLCLILPMLFVLLIAFCIAHVLSANDREKIRSAAYPEWETVDELPVSCRMEAEFGGYVVTSICIGISLLTALWNGFFWIGAVIGVVLVVTLLLTWHEHRFWSCSDGTAEVTYLPVDHFYYNYSLNNKRHSRRFLDKYAILVCYLPDGKYRFRLKTDIAPDEIRIVRYHHRYRIWM